MELAVKGRIMRSSLIVPADNTLNGPSDSDVHRIPTVQVCKNQDNAVANIKELILKDFRCMPGEQRGRLRPITLLVGENSTGKSSFMASYMAFDQCFEEQFINTKPDFNKAPFGLGYFDDIRYKGNRRSRKREEFTIGLRVEQASEGPSKECELTVSFCQHNSFPQVRSMRYQFCGQEFIEFERSGGIAKVSIPNYSLEIGRSLAHAPNYIDFMVEDSFGIVNPEMQEGLPKIGKYLNGMTGGNPSLYGITFAMKRDIIPIAPVRSSPKRDYSVISAFLSPEGDDIPMLMMRLSRDERRNWEKLREGLIEFGTRSQLFTDIKIKRYSREGNSPFQLLFKIPDGEFANIMDVGYGVSQCLPIIINILAYTINGKSHKSFFLLQQPEVHLHPRAQATLGSLICSAHANGGDAFMVETHSDFIVNRIRMGVKNGIVGCDDVSIIYFERNGDAVKLHNIELDADGNIADAPRSYRDFFLDETDRVLGFLE